MSRGLLLVGHGSHLNPDSSAPVRQHAAAIRDLGTFDEVRTGFWKEEPSLSRALDPFAASEIAVVPIFISAGYFTDEVIPREMGLTGPVTEIRGKTVRYTAPIGSHPALARVVTQRALEAGGRPRDALAVLGHGTPRNPNSERNVYEQAARAKELGDFLEVVTVFLDQEPNMREVFAMTTAETVVMVPLFVADGWHVGETIPEDLALDGPETRRGGRRLRYAGAVGTHPSVVDVILELAGRDAGGPAPGEAGASGPILSFDAMARGSTMLFGPVRIRREASGFVVSPDDSEAGWQVSAGEEVAPQPLPARCRFDHLGRYRPLSTARPLPSGWHTRVGTSDQLDELLESLFPLSVTHAEQWRDGALRVVSVDDVFQRQAGRYAVARHLSQSGREVARRSLCDRWCARSPLWDSDERRVDDVRGDQIPCPEPCSVFLSLCREAALWEQEPPARSPVEPATAFAAFDEPGNQVREEYLALRFGSSVAKNG